jgi:hypothetical protein
MCWLLRFEDPLGHPFGWLLPDWCKKTWHSSYAVPGGKDNCLTPICTDVTDQERMKMKDNDDHGLTRMNAD